MLLSNVRRAAAHPSIRASIFPGRYLQGSGAISLLGTELAKLGTKALIVADPFVVDTMSGQLKASLDGKIESHVEVFTKECCDEEIARLAAVKDISVVAGIGGGKAIDTSKAVGHTLGVPTAVVPTLASSDAPCSALSVIYTKTGEFSRYLVLPQNPHLVLVDSDVIKRAPVRFLVAGMGDALATWFEAESCFATRGGNMTGYMGSFAALGLARMCYDTLLEYGAQAKHACAAQASCPALERVIEANVLLSGLGFESGGLGASHAIHNGLTILEGTHAYWHGEKVAFGVLASLLLTDRPAAVVDTVFGFCEQVGLPTTLFDIGAQNVTDAALLKVGQLATAEGETIHNEQGVITAEAVANAMRAADAYGRARKQMN